MLAKDVSQCLIGFQACSKANSIIISHHSVILYVQMLVLGVLRMSGMEAPRAHCGKSCRPPAAAQACQAWQIQQDTTI